MFRLRFLSVCILLAAVACGEKVTPDPEPVKIPILENLLYVSGEDILQRCQNGLPSQWISADADNNLVFNSGIGNGRVDLYFKDYNDDFPPTFPVDGEEVEASVTIALPPASQAQAVPFSLTVPFSFQGKDIPEDFKSLSWVKVLEKCGLSLWFDDDTPLTHVISDLEVTLPSFCTFTWEGTQFFILGQNPTNTAYQEYAYLYSEHEEYGHPGKRDFPWPLGFIGQFQVTEEEYALPGRGFHIDSTFTVSGVLHLDSSMLKEGASWPETITLHGAFSGKGYIISTKGKMNYPAEYDLPRHISFSSLRDYRPISFLDASSVLHLYDGRVFLDFLNRSPFTTWITGTVESHSKSTVLYSHPFGEKERITAVPFLYVGGGGDGYCIKHIVFSESDRFPVEFIPLMEEQEHVSLHMDGLSHLLEGAPDEYVIGNLKVHRDPEEEVTLDFNSRPLYFGLSGRITMPLQAGSSFQLISRHDMMLPEFQPEEGRTVQHLALEGTLRSSFPLHVELMDVSADDEDIRITVETSPLEPCFGAPTSTQPVRIQLEAPYQLYVGIGLHFTFRLYADESCQGKPLSPDMYIVLSDISICY